MSGRVGLGGGACALTLVAYLAAQAFAVGPSDAGRDAGAPLRVAPGGGSSASASASPDAAASAPSARRDPAAAQRHWAEGLARFRADDVAGAVPLLRQAAAEDPGHAAILTDLGYALARAGERSEAEALYRRAILIEPERVYAYANLAELLTTDPGRWGRQDEMLALLGRGLRELDERGREALALQIARFEASVGRTVEARRRLAPLVAQGGAVAQRAQALLAQVAQDERAQQLVDWPDAEVPAAERAQLEEVRKRLDAATAVVSSGSSESGGAARSGTSATTAPSAEAKETLVVLDRFVQQHPGWIEARWQRARALVALGRVEPGRTDLVAVVQLQPTRAEAWRRLGVLLVEQGRDPLAADEALRHALALRPGATDLRDLRRRLAPRVAEARGLTVITPRLPEPTPVARRLYEEAQTWSNLNAPEMAGALVDRALAESPAFVEAAVLAFGLRRSLPTRTIDALAADGAALWELVERLRTLDRDGANRAQFEAWRDRAITAGVAEARYARAVQAVAMGAKAAALDDLRAYLATANPAHAAEARALGRSLLAPAVDSSPAAIARRLLVEDRAGEALTVLGAPCRASLAAPALLALADVYEHAEEPGAALSCLELAVGLPGDPRVAEARLASVAARVPAEHLAARAERLAGLARKGHLPAYVALARITDGKVTEGRGEAGPIEEALAAVAVFLRDAPGEDDLRPVARSLEVRLRAALDAQRTARVKRLRMGAGTAALVLLIMGYVILRPRLRAFGLARALRRRPSFFPDVAAAVGALRHDVLKHRASALSLLADPSMDRAAIARSVLEPEPMSRAVGAVYATLAQTAAAQGLTLPPIEREPVFGPLLADLLTVERALSRAPGAAHPELGLVDERLRGRHATALAGLLALGPRTLLDAATLLTWIDALRAERGERGAPEPQLHIEDPRAVLACDPQAVHAAFANLLRNAFDASAAAGTPVQVRLSRHLDAAGRRRVTLAVADAAGPLTDADIAARDPARGLGIVRELARRWNGRALVLPAAVPFTKAVAIELPAAVEEGA